MKAFTTTSNDVQGLFVIGSARADGKMRSQLFLGVDLTRRYYRVYASTTLQTGLEDLM
jgi:hypothetical protein